MRFDIKDLLKAVAFVAGLMVYYFTVSKDVEIRIVKLETNFESAQKLLQEIRGDVKALLTNRKAR